MGIRDETEIPVSCKVRVACDMGYAFGNSKPDYMVTTCKEGYWEPEIESCQSRYIFKMLLHLKVYI